MLIIDVGGRMELGGNVPGSSKGEPHSLDSIRCDPTTLGEDVTKRTYKVATSLVASSASNSSPELTGSSSQDLSAKISESRESLLARLTGSIKKLTKRFQDSRGDGFQLGVDLYQLVLASDLPPGEELTLLGELDAHQILDLEEFKQVKAKLLAKIPEFPRLAALIASLLDPDHTKRPSVENALELLSEHSISPEVFEGGLSSLLTEFSQNRIRAEIAGGITDPSKVPELIGKINAVFSDAVVAQAVVARGHTAELQDAESIIHKEVGGKVHLFVCLEKLGSGGYGDVYKVYNVTTGAFMALKRMNEGMLEIGEVELAREILASSEEGVFGVQKFIPFPHKVIDLRTRKEVEVNWVVSRAYKCDAFAKLDARAACPVSLDVTVRECYSLVSGFNNLMNVFGRLHLDLKLENFLCAEDCEMVVGDLGGLSNISSAEAWADSIQNETIHDVCTNIYNTKEDLGSLNEIIKIVRKVLNDGDFRPILKLSSILKLTKEEVQELKIGGLPPAVKEKFINHYFSQYKIAAERAAIFQLGTAFYALLVGNFPYKASIEGYSYPNEREFERVEYELSKIGYPEVLSECLKHMLDEDPAKRPTGDAVQAVFQEYLQIVS